MKLHWKKPEDELPNDFKEVLVLVSYLDAEYGENGYNEKKQFWTMPSMKVASGHKNIHGNFEWNCGGKVIKWVRIPEAEEINEDT